MLSVIGGAVIVLAIGLNLFLGQEEEAPPPTKATAQIDQIDQAAQPAETTPAPVPQPGVAPAPEPESAPKPAATPEPPSFDVVRIGPQGDTVMAGRAEPGSPVTILDGEKVIGTVTANTQGEWVFVTAKPLAPGSRELSLESRVAGLEPVQSKDVVVMVIPERRKDGGGQKTAKAPLRPLALKVPRQGSGPSIVLQKPAPDQGIKDGTLTVDAVDYDDAGRVTISGRATPGSMVRLYLDNRFIGESRAAVNGIWRLDPNVSVEPGLYRLRADQVEDDGKVVARVSFPFARAEPLAILETDSFVVVQPGNSLWRLARRSYGQGLRYTVIYQANQDQIENPDLIYPGQVFTLPVD